VRERVSSDVSKKLYKKHTLELTGTERKAGQEIPIDMVHERQIIVLDCFPIVQYHAFYSAASFGPIWCPGALEHRILGNLYF
jgi:hypothetical protein